MTNERMINSVAVGIVYVSGPGQYNIPDGEKGYILTEVVDGLEALSDYKPDANLSWHYWHVHANIDGVVPWHGARWKGLPEDFYKGFDAAVWRQSNNKIHLFKGDQYVRVTPGTFSMDSGYPKSIAGNWKNLPSDFTQGIDAGLYVPTNDRIYFFKGDQYARINPADATMDAGYPKPIAGNWKGIPSSFENGIDAALYNGFNDKVYLFKGSQYVRITPGSFTMDAGYPKNILNNWKGIPEFFTQNIDAALYSGCNNKIYFFKGSQYVRITFDGNGANMDSGFPANIAGNWKGLPASFDNGIDAAIWRKSNNKIYLFKGTQYVRITPGSFTMDEGFPAHINNNWMPFPTG